jgi:hypothetical protein
MAKTKTLAKTKSLSERFAKISTGGNQSAGSQKKNKDNKPKKGILSRLGGVKEGGVGKKGKNIQSRLGTKTKFPGKGQVVFDKKNQKDGKKQDLKKKSPAKKEKVGKSGKPKGKKEARTKPTPDALDTELELYMKAKLEKADDDAIML